MGMDWLKKKGLDKWFQRDNLIILVLAGILLFIIALPIEEKDETGGKGDSANASADLLGQTAVGQSEVTQGEMPDAGSTSVTGMGDEYDYASYLEERLKKMLAGVNGVGQVSVMITLKSSEELVLEKDEPMKQSNIQETDSAGGSRITTQMETNETTIYRTQGSDSEPYVIKRNLPQVEGVLVVAQGAGNGSVNKSITEIIQALFDIEAHKIKVVKMESGK